MTTTISDAQSVTHSTITTRLPRLVRTIRALIWRRRRAVRAHLELTRLDEKLLYDIGIDPLDIRAALEQQRAPSILFNAMRKPSTSGGPRFFAKTFTRRKWTS